MKETEQGASNTLNRIDRTRIRSADSASVVRLILVEPSISLEDVREQLGDVAHNYPDLKRHVRWRRRSIYAAVTALLRKRQDDTNFDPTSFDVQEVRQWIKVMWIVVNYPHIERSCAEQLTKQHYDSWEDVGYAPDAKMILEAIGTSSRQELKRLKNELAEQLIGETRNYSPDYVDEALSKLTQ